MATKEHLSTEDLVAPKDEGERPVTTEGQATEKTDAHEHGAGASIPEQPQAEDPQSGRHSAPGAPKSTVDQRVELFSRNEIEEFRSRWQSLQTAFVDDPRETVHSADELVAEVMQALATTFANHKRELENQWRQGEEIATEDLRLALQRYRTFFNELLRD